MSERVIGAPSKYHLKAEKSPPNVSNSNALLAQSSISEERTPTCGALGCTITSTESSKTSRLGVITLTRYTPEALGFKFVRFKTLLEAENSLGPDHS